MPWSGKRAGEQGAHRLLGAAVGLGHRAGIALGLDQQGGAEQRADHRARDRRRPLRRRQEGGGGVRRGRTHQGAGAFGLTLRR